MGRLAVGENAKIDHINNLVDLARGDNPQESKQAYEELLKLFHPMILSICKKWSEYFQDEDHKVKPWDILVADAQYWFMLYTKDKYTVDGRATYNNFIKNHINQRVRYIYECELKHYKHNIYPDPDKRDYDNEDVFDGVMHNYGKISCSASTTMLDDMIEEESANKRKLISDTIIEQIENTQYFNARETSIFKYCMIEGRTHEEVGRQFNISRTRVSQILGKTKKKLYDILDGEIPYWWGDD